MKAGARTVNEREGQRQRMSTIYFKLNMTGRMDNLTRSCMDLQMVYLRTGVLQKGVLGVQEELDAGATVVAWCDGDNDAIEPAVEWESLCKVRTGAPVPARATA